MDVLTLDFETSFSDEYTLKKLTTEAYIRDPRFQSLLLGVRDAKGSLAWYGHEEIPAYLASVDWSRTAVLAHHAHFDGLILAHHYGVKPRLWLDTLSMARQVIGNHVSAALGSLARHYGLADKSVPYELFKGRRWEELDQPVRRMLGEGCLHDIELTWDIFQRLAAGFPAEEYQVIDLTVRMFTEPTLIGDTDLLRKVWAAERDRKDALLAEIGVTPDELQSSDRFAELLRAEGLEPEMKAGKDAPDGTPRQIYAFAKTDDFMKEALESDDQRISALCQARLGLKSTIDQTRAERLGFMSTRGPMPVYIRYCGAHSTRWSGGDGVNWQNFRRGGDLRRAITAPPGCALVVLDLSQIEARILALVAGQWDLVEKFRHGEDPYVDIASEFYGFTVTKENKEERTTGKVAILQSGYGASEISIQAAAKKATPPVKLTIEQALDLKNLYRSRNQAIVNYWNTAGKMLGHIGNSLPVEWGPLTIRDKRVYLPNGGWIGYETMEYDADLGNWKYKTRQGWSRIWGSKLVAETTQALARVVASQAMLRMRAVGIRLAWCTHDDIVTVAPIPQAQAVYDFMLKEMKRPPAWLPDLPLDAEGFVGPRYSK